MNFNDKVILITGASRGIGKATALAFAKKGAKIVVNYNSSKIEAENVVKETEKLGSKGIAVKCDVSKENEVISMMSEIVEKFGKIDVLINNAGIVIDIPLLERTVEQRQNTLNVNLIGTFLCCKYAAKIMINQKSGKIINISSTNAINLFSPDAVDYDASKAGVILLTKDLAKELAPNIQVNAIAPGRVDTEMNKDLSESFIKQQLDKIFMKRFAQPEEIANVAVFLAGDEASYINGSVIIVDGGV